MSKLYTANVEFVKYFTIVRFQKLSILPVYYFTQMSLVTFMKIPQTVCLWLYNCQFGCQRFFPYVSILYFILSSLVFYLLKVYQLANSQGPARVGFWSSRSEKWKLRAFTLFREVQSEKNAFTLFREVQSEIKMLSLFFEKWKVKSKFYEIKI